MFSHAQAALTPAVAALAPAYAMLKPSYAAGANDNYHAHADFFSSSPVAARPD